MSKFISTYNNFIHSRALIKSDRACKCVHAYIHANTYTHTHAH